jgi:hypothetical protein
VGLILFTVMVMFVVYEAANAAKEFFDRENEQARNHLRKP